MSNSKQKKYSNIIQFYNLLNNEKNSIHLISHISDINIVQFNILKSFCQNLNIKNIYIKLNLIRKLTKNLLFINLFAGPTRMFFFKDLKTFLSFQRKFLLLNKIIPLCIIYNNVLYNYVFFAAQIKNYQKLGELNRQRLLVNIKNTNVKFLIYLSSNLNNFITFLTYLKTREN